MPGSLAVSVDEDPRPSQTITKELKNRENFENKLKNATYTVKNIVKILTQAQSDNSNTLFTGTNQIVIVNIINKIRNLLDTLTKEETEQLIEILLLQGFQEKVTLLKPNTINLLINKIKESKEQTEKTGPGWSAITGKTGGKRKSTRRHSRKRKSYRRKSIKGGRKRRSRRYK